MMTKVAEYIKAFAEHAVGLKIALAPVVRSQVDIAVQSPGARGGGGSQLQRHGNPEPATAVVHDHSLECAWMQPRRHGLSQFLPPRLVQSCELMVYIIPTPRS